MKLSQRVSTIQPSQTLAISAKAKKMKQDGIDVINLSAGEPDFDTFQFVKDAAVKSLTDGETKYAPVAGTPNLKDAIIKKYADEFNINYAPSEVIVSCGGKHVLYNLFQAIIDPGDEVIIPAPYWLSYPEQVRLAQGSPVILATSSENEYKITKADILNAITPNTKAVILNSPSNPTGMVYTKEELSEIIEILNEHPNILLISDDVYEKLLFDNRQFCNVLSLAPELKSHVFIVNSLSKTYSMTGWRIGYGLGDSSIISAMSTIQGQSTSGATTFCQTAAEKAILGDQIEVNEKVVIFQKRRDFVCSAFSKINGFTFTVPQGAFYLFLDVSNVYGKGNLVDVRDSISFCAYMLEKANVAMVPGGPFGEDRCVRISFATDDKSLANAIERIQSVL